MAGACASTLPEAAHAGSQALLAEPNEAPGTAVDAMVAGLLAIAAHHPAVLLGACTIVIGGMGEGRLVIDGRARQPGLGAPRPRGFIEGTTVPDAARIAAPGLPAALVLAHAGRGERTLTHLARIGLSSAATVGSVDPARSESVRAFAREGAGFIRGGAVRAALIAAAARSVGGTLTEEDLTAVRPELVPARSVTVGTRAWSIAPAEVAHVGAFASTANGDPPADATPSDDVDPVAIIAAVDVRGALAIAAVVLPRRSLALDGVGLSSPLLARPVMRGITRLKAGAPLPLIAPVAISRDLALGLGGDASVTRGFPTLLEHVSAEGALLDDAIGKPREGNASVACGVLFSTSREGRALADRRGDKERRG